MAKNVHPLKNQFFHVFSRKRLKTEKPYEALKVALFDAWQHIQNLLELDQYYGSNSCFHFPAFFEPYQAQITF